MMDEIALALEMSPIVFMKSAVVPTFLSALSEVCSLAVLAGWGGSLLRQPPCSQSQRECLSYRMLEANFRRFMKLGMAPWIWSV